MQKIPGLPANVEKLETDLKKSLERYQSLLEEIEDGYIELDLKGNITFFNSAFARFLEYSPEKLMGMSYREFMKKGDVQRVFKAFNHVYRTLTPNKAFDYELVRSDGGIVIGELSISLRKAPDGRPAGFRCIVRDITKRKQVERELETHRRRLEAIFESVNDAIVTVDNNMNVMEANAATHNICGVTTDNLVGKVLTDCAGGCSGMCHAVLQETLKNKTAVKDYQIECIHDAQKHQKVSISTSPLLDKDNRFLGAVLVIKDITRISDLERELKTKHKYHNIIGKSKKIQNIFYLLEDLSDIETTVLITGESGTGKELAARAIHYGGRRAFNPFVTVNCSALSENLLESELFGHVKGAFTGAIKDTQGRFQTANGGTILLDEIGDISPRIQLKLLRVLQEKEFERVGQTESIKVDIRVIACTNRDLKELVGMGQFREDLYYRLKVVEIELPPLRERKEDIGLLIDHFIQLFNRKFSKNIAGVSDEVRNAFVNYNWPGNIRELEHALERAYVLCHGDMIESVHIPSEIKLQKSTGRIVGKRNIDDSLRELVVALEKTGWNKAKAARLLGIDRRTVYRWLSKYDISKPHDLM